MKNIFAHSFVDLVSCAYPNRASSERLARDLRFRCLMALAPTMLVSVLFSSLFQGQRKKIRFGAQELCRYRDLGIFMFPPWYKAVITPVSIASDDTNVKMSSL